MAGTEFTVQVPKGVKVNVKEVDRLTDEDSRIPDDRHILISGPEQLKVAIKRSAGPGMQGKASVVLMCG